MRSPAANVEMEHVELEPGLKGHRCPRTGGVWLSSEAYRGWRTQPVHAEAVEPLVLGEDSPAGKRCPEDGYFLIRYAVGKGVDFHVERCGHCGGVWLDAGEWEALRQRGLAQSLHLVFTSAWQAQVRMERQAEATRSRLTKWFGDEDFAEAKRIRSWIDQHPRAYELRAYLDGEYDV